MAKVQRRIREVHFFFIMVFKNTVYVKFPTQIAYLGPLSTLYITRNKVLGQVASCKH